MNWTVRYPNRKRLRIRWAEVEDVPRRIAQFYRSTAAVPARLQQQVELYAEATYLKYRSARDEFSATANSIAEWNRRRMRSQETLALLEAWTDGPAENVAGALLLRSAWTGDIAIDFVVANKSVTQASDPPIENVGLLLVAAALDVGSATAAPLVWAETAAHSTRWWSLMLGSQHEFIRFDSVDVSRQRVGEFLRNNHVEFARE